MFVLTSDSAEKPGLAGIGAGGESLAAPRGVSDSESFRGCKQRPSKLSPEDGFSAESTSDS